MTNFTPTANPTAKAVAKHVRVTPMKARRVVDLVRGRSVEDALNILKFAPQAASEPVAKVIASAAANAENNLDRRHCIRRRGHHPQAIPAACSGPGIPDPQAHQPHHGDRRKPAQDRRNVS
jgi:hypothetical protein